MTGPRFRRALSVLAASGLVLTGCDSEPSDSDMKAAVEKTFSSINKELEGVGKIVGKDLATRVKAMKKIACAKAEGAPGHRCDFEMVVDGPLGEKSEKAAARFVKGDGGWVVLEK